MATAAKITRLKADRVVFCWESVDPRWAGRTSFVRLEGLAVVVGDRYGGVGPATSYECHPSDFLGGCFHESVRDEFGDAVLNEIVEAVKASGVGLEPRKSLPWPEKAWGKEPAAAPKKAPEAPAPSAPSPPAAKEPAAVQKKPASKARPADPGPKPAEGRVNVTLSSCRKGDLALVNAIKRITGAKAGDIRGQLVQLPMLLKTNATLTEAQAIKKRLGGLGGIVQWHM